MNHMFSPLLKTFLDRSPALHKGPGVLGVSGGADSVALLRGLVDLLPSQLLIVAHLNHRLRGVESDADQEFVRELASTLAGSRARIEFQTTSLNVEQLAVDERENLEGIARRERYRWLEAVAVDAGATWIATGHTADDQAETVLHRMIRGTGLQGLRGIARERCLPSGTMLVRPLLSITRGSIVDYLASLQQAYREDSSNADERYTRNRIRRELLPVLLTYNPRINEVLSRLAEQAEEMFDEQERLAEQLLRTAELPSAGSVRVLDCNILRAAPRHRVREALRRLWNREGWAMDAMTFEHWERCVDLISGFGTHTIDFPGPVRGQRTLAAVTFEQMY
jgi:tRNA(Ile)-lysidine synthase